MKIRIEYENKNDIEKLLFNLSEHYEIKEISKKYNNRPPSKLKRVYISLVEINRNE